MAEQRLAAPEMKFQNIVAENSATDLLKKAVLSGKIHHAYLLSGPLGTGKMAVALELAMALLCRGEKGRPCYRCSACQKFKEYNHPDFRLLFPFISLEGFKKLSKGEAGQEDLSTEALYTIQSSNTARSMIQDPFYSAGGNPMLQDKNRKITVPQIRALLENTEMPPSEAPFKVFIFSEPERMNAEAANAILKTLEEPRHFVKFILVSHRPNQLLPTIRSRCQMLKFPELSQTAIQKFLVKKTGANPEEAELAAGISLGSLQNAMEFLDPAHENLRSDALDIIECLVEKNSGRALSLAEKYGGDPISKSQLRIKWTIAFLRDINFIKGSLEKKKGNSSRFSARMAALGEQTPAGLLAQTLDRFLTAFSALEKNVSPPLVHAALFSALI